MNDELKRELYEVLARYQVLTLAYCDAQGPGACAVWFVVQEDLTLVYLSARSTRHGAALADGGPVAFTVQKDDQSWRTIQGVQGAGRAAPVAAEYRGTAWDAYSRRFPFVIQPIHALARALAAMMLWTITPTWLRWIDNSRGFGHKEELVLNQEVN